MPENVPLERIEIGQIVQVEKLVHESGRCRRALGISILEGES